VTPAAGEVLLRPQPVVEDPGPSESFHHVNHPSWEAVHLP